MSKYHQVGNVVFFQSVSLALIGFAQQCVHADGWIRTVKMAFFVA